jgi:hypothetical protein
VVVSNDHKLLGSELTTLFKPHGIAVHPFMHYCALKCVKSRFGKSRRVLFGRGGDDVCEAQIEKLGAKYNDCSVLG